MNVITDVRKLIQLPIDSLVFLSVKICSSMGSLHPLMAFTFTAMPKNEESLLTADHQTVTATEEMVSSLH